MIQAIRSILAVLSGGHPSVDERVELLRAAQLCDRLASARKARLRELPMVELRAEHAHLLQLKFWLELMRDRTPAEEGGLQSLQRRSDEFVAEIIRRDEMEATAWDA